MCNFCPLDKVIQPEECPLQSVHMIASNTLKVENQHAITYILAIYKGLQTGHASNDITIIFVSL